MDITVDFNNKDPNPEYANIPFPLTDNIMIISSHNNAWENYKKSVFSVQGSSYSLLTHSRGTSNYIAQLIKQDLSRLDARPYRVMSINDVLGYVRVRDSGPWDIIMFETQEDLMEFIMTWR